MIWPPETAAFFARFENLFQLWLHGEIMPRTVNEDFERMNRQRVKHVPKACRHGKTLLTCPECYINGFERGNAI